MSQTYSKHCTNAESKFYYYNKIAKCSKMLFLHSYIIIHFYVKKMFLKSSQVTHMLERQKSRNNLLVWKHDENIAEDIYWRSMKRSQTADINSKVWRIFSNKPKQHLKQIH